MAECTLVLTYEFTVLGSSYCLLARYLRDFVKAAERLIRVRLSESVQSENATKSDLEARPEC